MIFSHILISQSGRDIDCPSFINLRDKWYSRFSPHYFIGNGVLTRDGKVYANVPNFPDVYNLCDPSIAFLKICLIGNLHRTPITQFQLDSLINLLESELEEGDIPIGNIRGEGEITESSDFCLGNYLNMNSLRSQVRSRFTIYLSSFDS